MPDNKHIIYSAEDIYRYFSGKMNAAEMYAMEKASLNDTLLAEAMEGYHKSALFTTAEGFAAAQQHLNELKEKISGKTIRIKKYDTTWWKVAAAVLLLCGSVFAFYKLNTSNNNIAQNKTVAVSSAIKPTVDSTIAFKQNNSSTSNTIDSFKQDAVVVAADAHQTKPDSYIDEKKKPLIAKADSNNELVMNVEKINSPSSVSRSTATVPAIANTDKNDEYKSDVAENNKAFLTEPSGLYSKKNKLLHTIKFSGKVMDENNNAIPYATLFINTNKQSKTDANGLFNLSFTDSSVRLDVAAKDYYPKTIYLTSDNFADIVLSAKKNTLKKSTATSDTLTHAFVYLLYSRGVAPIEGWQSYLHFLEDQLSNSIYDDGRKVTGQTTVQFELNPLLQPVNFSFPESIDDDVNNALENLILSHSDGYRWRILPITGGIPGVVRLKIIF